MNSTFDDLRLAVVDVEGNGQQPPEIIEIAVVPVDEGGGTGDVARQARAADHADRHSKGSRHPKHRRS